MGQALTFARVRRAIEGGTPVADIVMQSWRRASDAAREGIFTAIVPEGQVAAKLKQVNLRRAKGDDLPLLGLTFSVKDNIHVAGMATTCNCPAFLIEPKTSAKVVRKLEDAGAILIGKNTLDQFATGLNGTRSPEPLCRNAINPAYIPGGSSSGSAVAVARGIVSFSLGSDTGGSGRVPAACNGIVGFKPSLGLVSLSGFVYNSRFFDVVPIFAHETAEALEILSVLKGYDPDDDYCRLDADEISLETAAVDRPKIAIPRQSDLDFFGDEIAQEAFARDLGIVRSLGASIVEIDYSLFREAGKHVFKTAMVAERLDAYAETMQAHPSDVHPAVRSAIEPGEGYSALDAFRAMYKVQAQRREARRILAGFDALIVPTVGTIFTIEAMLSDPMAKNSSMGTYTYFANPLDMCAVSVPGSGRRDGLPSAICINALAGQDGRIAAIAIAFEKARLRVKGGVPS